MPSARPTTVSKTQARPRAKRSRKEQGEQTKRAILEAAVELYAEAGVRGTGLMAIGERAGVHHATVLYHFGSSHRLLAAVLAERDRRFLEFTREATSAGGLQALAALPMNARFNVEYPVWAKLFTVLQVENLDADAEVHDYFVQRRAAGHALLLRQIVEARERGEVRADVDASRVVDAILAFAAGAQIQVLLEPRRFDLVAVYERFTEMLIRDLTYGLEDGVSAHAPPGSRRPGGRTPRPTRPVS